METFVTRPMVGVWRRGISEALRVVHSCVVYTGFTAYDCTVGTTYRASFAVDFIILDVMIAQ